MRRRVQRRTISQRSELLYDWHEYGVNPDTREIMLAGLLIHEDWENVEIDYRMSRAFISNLRFLETLGRQPILVHSNTCGGEWNYGMAIYDVITACPAVVTILSHAHARSMSSVLLQAADYRVLMPHTDFLIHHGSGWIEGPTPNVVAEVDWWKVLQEEMIRVYAHRAYRGPFPRSKHWGEARTATEIRRKLERTPEWYMSPREAVEWGFADAVLGDPEYENVEALLE